MRQARMAQWQKTVLAVPFVAICAIFLISGLRGTYPWSLPANAGQAARVVATTPTTSSTTAPMAASASLPTAIVTPEVLVGNFIGEYFTQVGYEAPPAGLRFTYIWQGTLAGSIDSVVIAQSPPVQTLVPDGSNVTLTMGPNA